jgi:hypothetical protein
MDGFQSQDVKKGDVRYDYKNHGVWVGDDIFIPRKVVIWAFQALIPADQEGDG